MPDSPRPGPGWLRAVPLLVILAAAAFGVLALRGALSFQTLQANHDALESFAAAHSALAALLFIAAYTGIVALSLPGATLCSLVGGYLFGVFPGALFNIAAATAGAVVVFLAARAGFGTRVAERLERSSGALGRMREGLRAGESSYLLTLRLIPAVPFVVANLLPAFLGVPLGRFALTTALGMAPATLVFTSAGAGLGAAVVEGRAPDLAMLYRPMVLAPLLGLAVLAIVPVLVRALRR